MRKICLALCLTLFTSLIHAAVMPVGISIHHSNHQLSMTDDSVPHCDEASSDAHKAHSVQSCHGENYQCCLGVVTAVNSNTELFAAVTENLVSINQSLVIRPMVDCIFKPPKNQSNFL